MKRLSELSVEGKKVFLRADLNVPIKNSVILDEHRIIKVIPTINALLDAGAKQVIIASHLGRPKGVDTSYSLEPVSQRINELLDVEVDFAQDCIGPISNKPVVILENTRFYEEDKKNDKAFAQQLLHGASIYVFDAFGAAHRNHASTTGVLDFVEDAGIGLLTAKELKALSFKEPGRPFVGIVGASKVSDKIPLLEGLLERVDTLLLGGAVIFTFYRALGLEVGKSLVEEDMVVHAKKLLEVYKDKIVLPIDIVVSETAEGNEIFTVEYDKIPLNMIGFDIGDASIELFEEKLRNVQTVFWNGPLGLFEVHPFEHATTEIAQYLSSKKINTIIGGGDTERAVHKYVDGFSHVSTGGGAALELVAGKKLVVLESLKKFSE